MHGADILTTDPEALFKWALEARSLTLLSETLAAAARKRSRRACGCESEGVNGSRKLPILMAGRRKALEGRRCPYPVAYVAWLEGYGPILRAELVEVPLPRGLFQVALQDGLSALNMADDWEWVLPSSAVLAEDEHAIPWASLRAAALANVAAVAPEALVLRLSLPGVTRESVAPEALSASESEVRSYRTVFLAGRQGLHPSSLLTFELGPKAAARWRLDCPIPGATDTLTL